MAKEEDYLKKFGNHLLEIKEAKNLSYRKIAANCNIEHSDIKRYVDGQINPTLLSLIELAKGLGIEPKELLEFLKVLDLIQYPMFDQCLPYVLVQVKNNKYKTIESFNKEFIFRFYRQNSKSCIKYIVSVKEYKNQFLTLDYYPKISLTPKLLSLDSIQDLRYRMLTKQNSFGYIGGTIMEIMLVVQKTTNINTWGFLAANLITEITNANNKRYIVYSEVLRRSFYKTQSVLGNKDKSAIFVVPNSFLIRKESIIKEYEQIFSETN